MGNALAVEIQLDNNEAIVAGDTLTGRVVVQVRKSMKPADLKLHISGEEQVYSRRASMKTDRPVHSFFAVDLPLGALPRDRMVLATRTYTFPFRIELPESLPSSSFYKHRSTSGYRIWYYIELQAGPKRLEKHFIVQSASLHPSQHLEAMVSPTVLPIKAGRIYKFGDLLLAARVENTNTVKGGVLHFAMSCRNFSTTDIVRTELRLLERLSWNAGGVPAPSTDPKEVSSSEKETWNAKFTLHRLSDLQLSTIGKTRKSRKEIRHSRNEIKESSSTYREMYDEVMSSDNRITIPIPANARESYAGHLVQVTHYLEIKLHTAKMVTNPAVRIPIRIGRSFQHPQVQEGAVLEPEIVVDGHDTEGQDQHPTLQHYQQDPWMEEFESEPVPVVFDEGIPFAHAVAISVPEDAIHAPMASAPTQAIELENSTSIPLNQQVVPSSQVLILDEISDDDQELASPAENPYFVEDHTFDFLLDSVATSLSAHDLLAGYLEDPAWIQVVGQMSPVDYGRLISSVQVEFDQPRVARLLAPHLNGGFDMTCEHAAAAISVVTDSNKPVVARSLLPLVADMDQGFPLILQELNAWDQQAIAEEVQAAIHTSNMSSNYRRNADYDKRDVGLVN